MHIPLPNVGITCKFQVLFIVYHCFVFRELDERRDRVSSLRLDKDVLRQIDLDSALREASRLEPGLLPPDPAVAAAASRPQEYVELLRALLRIRFPVNPAAIAYARKSRRGSIRRPAVPVP